VSAFIGLPYNPADWFWIVGDDESRVWSSKAAAWRPADHADYKAWQDRGGYATHIASEDELAEVLRTQYPPGWPVRVIRSLAFRQRLSDAKRAALSVAAMQAAAQGDGTLLTFLLDQASSTETDLDDPKVKAGVQALRAADLITAAEATALLADGTEAERV